MGGNAAGSVSNQSARCATSVSTLELEDSTQSCSDGKGELITRNLDWSEWCETHEDLRS